MRKGVIAGLAFLLVAACGKGGGGGVVGTWQLDVGQAVDMAVKEQQAQMGADNEMAKAMIEAMKNAIREMKVDIELKSDKTFEARMASGKGQSSSARGRWEERGNTVVLTTTETDGKPATGEDAKTIELVKKGDHLELTEGGATLVLKRK
jgi:hypothetical protein